MSCIGGKRKNIGIFKWDDFFPRLFFIFLSAKLFAVVFSQMCKENSSSEQCAEAK